MEPRDESALTVRTVTVFLSADHCRDPSTFQASLSTACTIANAVRDCLITAGVSVQTIRLSVPGPAVFGSPSSALRAAKSLDIAAVDYASLGTVHPDDDATFLDSSFFSEVINTTSTVFLSLTTTSSTGEPSLLAIRRAAETISRLAKDDPSGLENMRFAALSNVRPGCPFFPASFSSSTSPTSDAFPVALGVQAAPLLHTGPLSELPCRVENAAQILVDACKSVQDVACDFSTAPLPGWRTSAAASIARIAGGRKGGFGKPGTLAAAASVASALDRAKFPRAGLCGIMLPVAEDTALTRSERPLRLNDLLMTSAVCGTGLDVGCSRRTCPGSMMRQQALT